LAKAELHERPTPGPWVLASHNRGKLAEFRSLLGDVELKLASEFGLSPPAEPENTFVENALIKARFVARATGLPALADDSGLMVDALGGAPGVHSAVYAGEHQPDAAHIEKLLRATVHVAEGARGCQFVCVLVLVQRHDDPLPSIAQGIWRGELLRECRGTGGFGYDPIFFDPQTGMCAAEMDHDVKARLSHRGRALAALRTML